MKVGRHTRTQAGSPDWTVICRYVVSPESTAETTNCVSVSGNVGRFKCLMCPGFTYGPL